MLQVSSIHGNLSKDPKESIERKLSIFGKKIQVQYIILAGTTAVVAIGSLLFGENTNEDATRSH